MSSSLHKRLMQSGIVPPSGLPPKMPGSGLGGKGRKGGRSRDYYSPVQWDTYFQTRNEIKIGDDSFNVYESGSEGPVLILLHGGGFSGLTWSLFAQEITKKVKCRYNNSSSSNPVFTFILILFHWIAEFCPRIFAVTDDLLVPMKRI